MSIATTPHLNTLRAAALLSAISVFSCAPAPVPPPRPTAHAAEPSKPDAPSHPQQTNPAAPPAATLQPLQYTSSRHHNLTLHGVAFDSREYKLRVLDQKNGPGSEFTTAQQAARAHNAIAAANGGFFTPDGRPLGLVVADGITSGNWNNSSSLGSAVWLEDASGRSLIARRSPHARSLAASAHNLLQSGPLLIEHGHPVSGLDSVKSSTRTFLLWDGGHRWWMGQSSPVSLQALANSLARNPPTPWQPALALNLDGGRSSDLWLASSSAGPQRNVRSPWNRTVRNYLVLLPSP